MVDSSSDARLVLRLKTGDDEALAELYTLYRSRVYRFALKLLRDADQAEDVAQETFLRAGAAIHTLNRAHSLISWLLTIARNEAYGYLRKAQTEQRIEEDDVWESATTLDDLVEMETTELVQKMVAGLRPSYREAILLREYEQLSCAEISRITGDTEGAVKTRLFRARRALVKKLKPYLGG